MANSKRGDPKAAPFCSPALLNESRQCFHAVPASRTQQAHSEGSNGGKSLLTPHVTAVPMDPHLERFITASCRHGRGRGSLLPVPYSANIVRALELVDNGQPISEANCRPRKMATGRASGYSLPAEPSARLNMPVITNQYDKVRSLPSLAPPIIR